MTKVHHLPLSEVRVEGQMLQHLSPEVLRFKNRIVETIDAARAQFDDADFAKFCLALAFELMGIREMGVVAGSKVDDLRRD